MTVQKMQAAVQKTRIKQITQPRYSSHNRRTEPDTPPTVPAVHRTGRSAKLAGGLCVAIERPHRAEGLLLARHATGRPAITGLLCRVLINARIASAFSRSPWNMLAIAVCDAATEQYLPCKSGMVRKIAPATAAARKKVGAAPTLARSEICLVASVRGG
jgi:hypothetical protein